LRDFGKQGCPNEARGDEVGTPMRRRDFITLIGVAAAVWPFAARAQQLPRVGIAVLGKREQAKDTEEALRRGLAEVGYIENQNVIIEWRYADNNYANLPNIMADFVGSGVDVIVAAAAIASTNAAKAATKTIPIVFMTGADPVELGWVESLAHPGGNLTGVAQLQTRYIAKRLELLHQLVPSAETIALITNPGNPFSRLESAATAASARSIGVELQVANAINQDQIDTSFQSLMALGVRAIVLGGDALFYFHARQIAALASRYSIPVMGQWREYPAAGGLISYGNNIPDALLLTATYAGRILKGEKPADMPVQQPTKFELVVNLNTAKALGLSIPDKVVALADEVIE
jgi:putative ABC transport system substrate-binding protein